MCVSIVPYKATESLTTKLLSPASVKVSSTGRINPYMNPLQSQKKAHQNQHALLTKSIHFLLKASCYIHTTRTRLAALLILQMGGTKI